MTFSFIMLDIGWVTGHSYIVYALMHGTTQIMYEGAPDYPKPDRYWKIIVKNTALQFYIPLLLLYECILNLEMLFLILLIYPRYALFGTVGEPINPEVWMWYFKTIGKENCPIIDTWWQTETGGIMISACPGVEESVPNEAGFWYFSNYLEYDASRCRRERKTSNP